MNWRLVPLDEATPQAWRNGGGTTRELLAWPSPQDWRVRISVADVQAAGPFSRFEGIERWFAVLEGAGVVLRSSGLERRLTLPDAPLRFDGGVDTDCALVDGPTRDFNLMAPPGRSTLVRLRGTWSAQVAAGSLVALYAHHSPAQCISAGDAVQVPARHLAWRLSGPAGHYEIQGDEALWMEVAI